MKNVLVFALGLATISTYAMETGGSDAQEGLRWLAKDSSYIAPEKAVAITYGLAKGMSFLTRYMEKNFNEYDIYEDVVYFNECESSQATYGMTYMQIKHFLQDVSEMHTPSPSSPVGQLEQKYIQLINKWKAFDAQNTEYRQAWLKLDWEQIRKIVSKK